MAKETSEIPQGTTFRGEVRFNSVLKIHGTVEGTVQGGGTLIVDQQGFVNGDVRTEEVDIRGKLQGTISDAQFVHIEKEATLLGDIECKQLQVDKGGVHNGTTVMSHG